MYSCKDVFPWVETCFKCVLFYSDTILFTAAGWPNILCVCSVFSSGSVQLHWSQWPSKNSAEPRWFSTSKGLLGAGPSGIMAADAIITESGALHVAGVPLSILPQ
jgi:hypothetical protein